MSKSVMPKSKAKTAYGLLNAIKRLIVEEPRRYDQRQWRTDIAWLPQRKVPECGTVCCVAGWVETLTFKKVIPPGSLGFVGSPVFERARKRLGLTTELATELFHPDAIERVNPSADIGTIEYALAGAEHITRFQKKYARQLKAKRV